MTCPVSLGPYLCHLLSSYLFALSPFLMQYLQRFFQATVGRFVHVVVKLYVGITDYDWFKLHASKESLGQVNFWRPSDQPYRKDFQPGMPFLFKLHAPENAIVGGGFFLKFLALPLSLAWGTLGEANGARTLEELRALISKRRRVPIKPNEDPVIGCTILGEPFFFDKSDWFPGARYVKPETVSGKGNFDIDAALELWREVTPRLERARAKTLGPATVAALNRQRYGSPTLVAPRLGQGSFRALVTDAYHYRCAITLERNLPVLQAAHT